MNYLYKEGDITFAECTECKRVMKFKEYYLPEVKDGIECFCGNVSNSIDGAPEQEQISPYANYIQQKPAEQKSVNSVPVVTCPACGAFEVKEISPAFKAAGGVMLGLFSNSIRSIFKCEKCGCKWQGGKNSEIF